MMQSPLVLACLATHPDPAAAQTLNTNEDVATSLSFSKAPLTLYLSFLEYAKDLRIIVLSRRV
jgi:hypothetical protein